MKSKNRKKTVDKVKCEKGASMNVMENEKLDLRLPKEAFERAEPMEGDSEFIRTLKELRNSIISENDEIDNMNEAITEEAVFFESIEEKSNNEDAGFITFLADKVSTDKQAALILGRIYYHGERVEKDQDKAYRYLLIAAEAGYPEAMFWLGAICEDSDSVHYSLEDGFSWFLKSATQDGNDSAMFQVGTHYLKGRGVKRDYQKAMECFMKSAEHNYPCSENSIGTMYFRGQGVDKNSEEAMKWFKRAAIHGDGAAICNLADGFLYGTGFEKDRIMALGLYRIAADMDTNSRKRAHRRLAELGEKADLPVHPKVYSLLKMDM